jgi:hypothetical protein
MQGLDNYRLVTFISKIKLHSQWSPRLRGWFVEVRHGFPCILLGSRALKWMMSGMVLGDVASRHRLYLAAKPSHVGIDVDRLAYLLHYPTVCSCQTRGQGFLSGVGLSRRAAMGDGF